MKNYSQANVSAVNKANAIANTYQPQLISIFSPLVGQKIVKENGELMKKVKALIPNLPNTTSERVYLNLRKYNLSFTVSTCVNDDNISIYHTVDLYIGHVSDGILVSVCTSENLNDYCANWTLAKITNIQTNVRLLEKELNNCKALLGPFQD